MNRRLIVLIIGMQGLALWLCIALLAVSVYRGPEGQRAPCPSAPAIPIDFVTAYPECADAMLRAMNITNVHVHRFTGTLPGTEVLNDPVVVAWRAATNRSRRNQS